jgi:hypothetical protein
MAGQILNNARHDLNSRRDRLRNAAIERSGLNGNYPQGEEVRSALRELSPQDRDKAVQEAVDSGDAWIVGSVVRYPDLLTGKLSLSKAMLTDVFIERASPELHDELAAIDTAFEHLALAEDSFSREAERMRDIEAENRADADRKAIDEAEALFHKALGGAPKAEEGGGSRASPWTLACRSSMASSMLWSRDWTSRPERRRTLLRARLR